MHIKFVPSHFLNLVYVTIILQLGLQPHNSCRIPTQLCYFLFELTFLSLIGKTSHHTILTHKENNDKEDERNDQILVSLHPLENNDDNTPSLFKHNSNNARIHYGYKLNNNGKDTNKRARNIKLTTIFFKKREEFLRSSSPKHKNATLRISPSFKTRELLWHMGYYKRVFSSQIFMVRQQKSRTAHFHKRSNKKNDNSFVRQAVCIIFALNCQST